MRSLSENTQSPTLWVFDWKLRVVAVALHDEGSATLRELTARVEGVADQKDVALVGRGKDSERAQWTRCVYDDKRQTLHFCKYIEGFAILIMQRQF